MDRFQMTEDLLTGISDIDDQHRRLFELAQLTVEPDARREGDANFFKSVAFLSDYVHFHFASEALAMKRTSFPDRAEHCRDHAIFVNRLARIIESSLEAPSVLTLKTELTELISGWLRDHIRVADKGLARYLKQCAGDSPATLPDLSSEFT